MEGSLAKNKTKNLGYEIRDLLCFPGQLPHEFREHVTN